MDGAIGGERGDKRIGRGGGLPMPDASIETTESGTRHRTAERAAKQTGFPVISVSQSMHIVAVYVADQRYVLEDSEDRKSTRLNSSHVAISYAVFCLKKKINQHV